MILTIAPSEAPALHYGFTDLCDGHVTPACHRSITVEPQHYNTGVGWEFDVSFDVSFDVD